MMDEKTKWLSVRSMHLRKDTNVIGIKYSFSTEAESVPVPLATTRTKRKSSQCCNVIPTQ